MKDYKVLFGYAAILLSIGFVIRSITFAYAYPTGPSVSMGSIPYETFAGGLSVTGQSSSPNKSKVLLTVPSDNIFVVTTCITGNRISINEVISGTSSNLGGWGCHTEGALRNGNSHIVVDSGAELKVSMSGSTQSSQSYFIEGYYAHP